MADDIAALIADVYDLAGRLRRAGEQVAATQGQTQARWQALSVVSERPCTVPQAGRRLGISRQGLQPTANELVRDGLAEFLANPDHRASPLLAITPAGSLVLADLNRASGALHRTIAGAARADRIAVTHQVVTELIAALRTAD